VPDRTRPLIRLYNKTVNKDSPGLADIAQEGELYFNLHTKGQTYYGDMRGQVYPVGTSGGFFPKSRSADGVSE